MLHYVLTPERVALEVHKSHTENSRIELKFSKPLTEAITCLLYLDYDNLLREDFSRNVTTDI
jgi:hypothetical protein